MQNAETHSSVNLSANKLKESSDFDATEKAYSMMLKKAMSDRSISDKERKTIIQSILAKRKGSQAQAFIVDQEGWLEGYMDQQDAMRSDMRLGFDFVGHERNFMERNQENNRLLISIDNKDIHRFVNNLIELAVENDYYDLNLEINNDSFGLLVDGSPVNYRDNITIYTKNEDFLNDLALIEQTIENTPDLKMNDQHLLSIPCGKNVRFVPKSSHDSFEYNVGFALHSQKSSPEDYRESVDSFIQYQTKFGSVAKLANALRNEDDSLWKYN